MNTFIPRTFPSILALTSLLLTAWTVRAAQNDPFKLHPEPPLVGRWDLVVTDGDLTYPSWLEVELSGYRTLVGRYLGRFGSARPVAEVKLDGGQFSFVIPPQWEKRTNEISISGSIQGVTLRGETTNDKGNRITFEGKRTPTLERKDTVRWGKPIELFNGKDFSGWKPRHTGLTNGWQVRDGVLVNFKPGNDLVTEKKFTDFKVAISFRYPEDSNSGLYLRGRYEVQIEDNHGKPPDSHRIGGVYGFLTPRVNAAKAPGEWQTIEVELRGREVTIVLNGKAIIEHQNIPGITGGALDSNEGEPGPLMLQGDHGQVEFRKIILTPARTEPF